MYIYIYIYITYTYIYIYIYPHTYTHVPLSERCLSSLACSYPVPACIPLLFYSQRGILYYSTPSTPREESFTILRMYVCNCTCVHTYTRIHIPIHMHVTRLYSHYMCYPFVYVTLSPVYVTILTIHSCTLGITRGDLSTVWKASGRQLSHQAEIADPPGNAFSLAVHTFAI